MDLGGPVWHASASLLQGVDTARRAVRHALKGVGAANLGEWEEVGHAAIHLRRRLASAEQHRVGPVVDVRGTAEAQLRLDPVRHLVPAEWTQPGDEH